MIYFLYIYAAIGIIYGLVAMISPKGEKQFGKALFDLLPPQFWAVISFIFAWAFWAVAEQTALPEFIQILAVIAIIKAVILIIPTLRRSVLSWWKGWSGETVRIYGIVATLVSLVVLWAAELI